MRIESDLADPTALTKDQAWSLCILGRTRVDQKSKAAMTAAWSEPGSPRRAFGFSSIDGNAPSADTVVTPVVRPALARKVANERCGRSTRRGRRQTQTACKLAGYGTSARRRGWRGDADHLLGSRGRQRSHLFSHPYRRGHRPGRSNEEGGARDPIRKIKVIRRRAYGLPRFASFRQRVLVACG